MSECISTHDNPSVQNKSYVTLNPVNLKPFYIKPYLTHESKIRFAEAEMKKLRQMGILRRGSCEFLSPIMLIKKSHSGATLNKAPEYRLVVDFKYLNSHLPDIKFSYPKIKHVLHKIGRHSSRVYSMLDLKHAFHSVNLTEDSKQYTSCCASPGSPTYQYNKLSQGLNISPAYFTSLMNDLLMLKKYGMLLTINKVHTFRSKVKYMGLLLSTKDNLPTITTLGSCVKAISTLPIPLTVRGIKSFIHWLCYIFSTILAKAIRAIKLINDILKKCNKVDPADRISPLQSHAKGKGKGKKMFTRHPKALDAYSYH